MTRLAARTARIATLAEELSLAPFLERRGGTLSLGFELVRHVAKQESPLVQLVTSPTIISTIADITFYGADRVGNEVQVTGSILIDFGNFGDQ